MLKKIIIITIFLIPINSFAHINVENDTFGLNTYGNIKEGFGGKFNYNYDKFKIKGKAKIDNKNKVDFSNYKIDMSSLYAESSINDNNKLRIGLLPLIDEIDYQKISEDLNDLGENKITSYEGVNFTHNEKLFNQDFTLNNIAGRYRNSRDNKNFYENVLGINISIKDNFYKFSLSHSIIEPEIKTEPNFSLKGNITSFNFDYKNDFIKTKNEYAYKTYGNNKTVDSFDTKLEFLDFNKFIPYTNYNTEYDSLGSGNTNIIAGVEYSHNNYLSIDGFIKKELKFNEIEKNIDKSLSLSLNLKY